MQNFASAQKGWPPRPVLALFVHTRFDCFFMCSKAKPTSLSPCFPSSLQPPATLLWLPSVTMVISIEFLPRRGSYSCVSFARTELPPVHEVKEKQCKLCPYCPRGSCAQKGANWKSRASCVRKAETTALRRESQPPDREVLKSGVSAAVSADSKRVLE